MSVRKTVFTVASAASLAIAGTAVQRYEGYAPTVKPDLLAGGLPTGGFGETVGVRLGETHSKKYWADLLEMRLREDYDRQIGECIRVQLPDGVRAYAISTAYNAGPGAVCSSPMVAKWNAGDVEGGCKAIKGWRISSRPRGPGTPLVVQRGLVNRRNDESAKCLGYANGTLKPPEIEKKPVDERRAETPSNPKPITVAASSPAPAPCAWWRRCK